MRILRVLTLLAVVLTPISAAAQTVTGSAIYRERIAMPPGAVFRASLLDVSLADVPATVLGEAVIEDAGNPPYGFDIAYDPAGIVEGRSYAVRAELRLDGRLLFTTDTVYPVLTRGAGNDVEIVMVRVPSEAERQPIPAHGLRLPASFTGTLPCADCAGIRHHLDLWPDQVFHLRRAWLGGDAPPTRDEIGRWHVDPERAALILRGGAEAPLAFQITGPETLRALDTDGNPIVSDLPYDLASLGRLEPTDIATFLNGEFVYFADAGVMTECLTGRRYPVAMEGDYLALERAYLDARPDPQAPVLAVIEGQIVLREGMEGGMRRMIVVDRFASVWPGQTCARNRADAALTNTYWRIAALLGAPVAAVAGQREPHLLIRGGEDRFSATVGCNRMNGALTQGDETLRFGMAMSTMMACPPPLEAAERALAEVLERTARYRIVGQTMEFFDADGAAIAALEAVYLP